MTVNDIYLDLEALFKKESQNNPKICTNLSIK